MYASSGAHRDVLLPSGGLGHCGSSAGHLFVPPSFALLRGPIFSAERCRGIHPSTRSFNWLPGQYPSVRCTNLSVAELPTARCGGFYQQALGRDPICPCRRRREPGSRVAWEPGAYWLVPSYRPSRPTFLVLAYGVWEGGLVGDVSVLPSRSGFAPTGLGSRSFAGPFSHGFSSPPRRCPVLTVVRQLVSARPDRP
jgi:hypothetical protein